MAGDGAMVRMRFPSQTPLEPVASPLGARGAFVLRGAKPLFQEVFLPIS